jgi:histidinol-phosphate phosphatase family protein
VSDAPRSAAPTVSIVIPSIGRPSLGRLLDALAASAGPAPLEVVVVDDRRRPEHPLPIGHHRQVTVIAGPGRGPAAARNLGWRSTAGQWVAFLDDDVVPGSRWCLDLDADLTGLPSMVAGSQGRLRVPLPADRRPTDWERNVAGLEGARWATADLAYRRDVLAEVGGFDERFTRAFREDSDLGLRVSAAGYLIVRGERIAEHPVRPAGRAVSVSLQAGNADDAAMRARWGPGWRVSAGAEGGRTGRHLVITAAAAAAALGALSRRRSVARLSAAVWSAGTAELIAARVRPGPRSLDEVTTMVATSAVLPLAAVAHLGAGYARLPTWRNDTARAPLGLARSPLALSPARLRLRSGQQPRTYPVDPTWQPAAILFDRDGTLIVDTPGNLDPAAVRLMPGARTAVRRAREAGLAVGVVTNQAAVGRGDCTRAEVDAVNRRVDELLGPFDTWQVCPHTPEEACGCRKPAPGLVLAAAEALALDPGRCAVIGDIASDLAAAAGAGARSVLVPTTETRPAEIAGAGVVARDILDAVDVVLAGLC